MTQVLEQPREIEDLSAEPMAQILRLDRSQVAAAPVLSRVAPAPLAPAGWYPEPPRLRFWDGRDWTDETRPVGPPLAVRVVSEAVAPAEPVETTPLVEPATGGPVHVGLLGMPPAAFESGARVSAAPQSEPGLLHELKILLLVVAVAVAAGALVTTIGIILTV
jgi:hypothetical protein